LAISTSAFSATSAVKFFLSSVDSCSDLEMGDPPGRPYKL
jgi:hypothetical protein